MRQEGRVSEATSCAREVSEMLARASVRRVACAVLLSCVSPAASFLATPTPLPARVAQLPRLGAGSQGRGMTPNRGHGIARSNPPATLVSALSTERKAQAAGRSGAAPMGAETQLLGEDALSRDGDGPPPQSPWPGPESTGTRTRTRQDDRLDDLAMQAAKSADMGLRYDPMTADKEFQSRTLDVWRRDLQISVPLTLFLGQVLIDFQRGVEKENRPMRAKQFMEIIAGLGPAFIKAGQALSSRPDLLPPEYLQELQKLQDRLPPFPNDVAFRIIEDQLGVPMAEVFDRVEPEPVAAASIGQVYKGYLRTGESVAIKVQRPECEDIIALDIYILRELSGTLSQMIKLLRRDIDLRSIVEEFGKLIYEEIDYLQEARNAQRFAELYGTSELILVPRIYWRFCKQKLLVMEWIEGERLTSPKLAPDIKTKLVRAMTQCSLQQMLEKGFFHADPHGGNLLATADGRLVYLDFGMMSEVPRVCYQDYNLPSAMHLQAHTPHTHACISCAFLIARPRTGRGISTVRDPGGCDPPREPRLPFPLPALRALRFHPPWH